MAISNFEHLSSIYIYVRGRQLEGTYSDDPDIGMWPISAARISRGWGNPSRTEWPYISGRDEWPPDEPGEIDALAKTRRINRYQRIRSAEECCLAIKHMMPVVASFNITKLWFDASGGEIEIPPSHEQIIGGHGVCMVGVDSDRARLAFVNSWGSSWGSNGFGTMPFEYFDLYMTDAWTMAGYAEKPPIEEYSPGIQYLNWGFTNFLGSPMHVIEVYDHSNDERVGWVFAPERDGILDVEEFFVKPSFRGQGYGRALMTMVTELRELLKRPIRIWLSHADCDARSLPIAEGLLTQFGFRIEPSSVTWASGLATEVRLRGTRRAPIGCPPTPRFYWPLPTRWSVAMDHD